ncbi:MAG: NAD(P)/FAD-dependent oxidoreductase [Longimicrobiales bacterium]
MIVVGGGVIGISAAYELARAGAAVTVLERDRVGAGASSGNAGTIAVGHPPLNRPGRIAQAIRQMTDSSSPLFVKPRVDPGLWRWLVGFARYCTDAHVQHCMHVMAPLGRHALSAFARLLEEERIECEYTPGGYLEVCSTEAGMEGVRHEAEIIEGHGYRPEVIDGDEVRRREPALGPDRIGAVHYPESATLIPSLFLARLTAAAERRGVRIRSGAEVAAVTHHRGRVTGVTLRSGETVGGDAVVLATGPYSRQLARPFGVRVPVQPGKGYHRDVDIGPNGAPPLRIACVLAEHSVFCTPMDSAIRFAGTMEFSGENDVMRPERLRQLTHAARAAFPDMGTARPRSEWCGLRPMSMDGLPIVGPVPGVEGLVLATGHGMLGLTLGPITGEIVASQVLGGSDSRAKGLLPDRFV